MIEPQAILPYYKNVRLSAHKHQYLLRTVVQQTTNSHNFKNCNQYLCLLHTLILSRWTCIAISGHDSTISSSCQAVIMTVDKHELLFRILNRELFSLWANCVHDLAVKIQALGKLFILDYFAGTWTCISMFPFVLNSSEHVEWVDLMIWHELTFK